MKHFAKHLAVMALAAGIGLTGTAANATDCTTTTYSSALNFSGGTASFGDTFSKGTTCFNDLFTFTNTSANAAGASASAKLLNTSAPVNFTKFNLMNETPPTPSIATTGTIGPSFYAYFLGAGLNASTPYGLNVVGTVNPKTGGSYTGNISQIGRAHV